MNIHRFFLDMFEVSGRVLIVGSGREGEAQRLLEPLEVQELFQQSDRLNERLNESIYLDEEALGDLKKAISGFGEFLFETVFARELGRLFAATQGSLGGDDSLQIVIRIGAPRLASVLWEVMREEKNFIGHKYYFVRYPMIRSRCPENIAITPPVKMLVVAADPLGNLQIQRELDALERSLANLEDRVTVTTLVEPNATFANIDKELKKGPHIFHFIGHGAYNRDDPEASYLLIDGEFRGNRYGRLPLESISATLAMSPTSLIFLNACRMAGSVSITTSDEFVSMAYSLVRLGNKAVVAMSHAILDTAATILSATFYKGIIKDGEPLDVVLTRCKNDLYSRVAQGETVPSDWCAPVLYTRAGKLQFIRPA